MFESISRSNSAKQVAYVEGFFLQWGECRNLGLLSLWLYLFYSILRPNPESGPVVVSRRTGGNSITWLHRQIRLCCDSRGSACHIGHQPQLYLRYPSLRVTLSGSIFPHITRCRVFSRASATISVSTFPWR